MGFRILQAPHLRHRDLEHRAGDRDEGSGPKPLGDTIEMPAIAKWQEQKTCAGPTAGKRREWPLHNTPVYRVSNP